VPPVEQELLTLPENLSSPPVLVGSVLLDLRWTCKLTDFGVSVVRFADRNINEEAYDSKCKVNGLLLFYSYFK
jgi:hypothetical protein